MKNYIKYIAILALGMVACEPEFENPVDDQGAYSSGEADFTNYVALGNSLTAGYADNALYITGQQNSYPNILARQFAKVGGGDFTQPLMADNAGGLLLDGNVIAGTRLVLAFDAEGNPAPRPYTGSQPSTEVSNRLTGDFNNMGVPGAKSFHLGFKGYGNLSGVATGTANPYFVRFASEDNATVIADAAMQNPTFFSLWIGNNDVLSFATSGGSGVYQADPTVKPSAYGSNDITNPMVFAAVYDGLVETMVNAGAEEGVLINIPSVTDVPFFTTVPFAPLSPANPSFGPMIPTLNATFAQLNPALTALRGVSEETPGESVYSIEFSQSAASPVLVHDESLTDISEQLRDALIGAGMDAGLATIYGMQYGQARQATAEDLLVLTSSGAIGQVNTNRVAALMAMGLTQEQAGRLSVNGVTYPMEDKFVLVPSEQELISTATQAYNQAIQQIAQKYDLAYVDAAATLQEIAGGGIAFDGGILTSEFARGGAFSLDGVHLTPRGYALVANKIIEAVNSTYNATVPKVKIGNFGTITPNQDVN